MLVLAIVIGGMFVGFLAQLLLGRPFDDGVLRHEVIAAQAVHAFVESDGGGVEQILQAMHLHCRAQEELYPLQEALLAEYSVQVPVMRWAPLRSRFIRISAQAYNSPEQYEYLAAALTALAVGVDR